MSTSLERTSLRNERGMAFKYKVQPQRLLPFRRILPQNLGEKETNPIVRKKKEIIKIRSEINEKEMKETIEKINKTKSWLFEKLKKIDKPIPRLINKKREKTQITRIRN